MEKPNNEKQVYLLGFSFNMVEAKYTRTTKVIKLLQILGYDSSKIIGRDLFLNEAMVPPYEDINKRRIKAVLDSDEVIVQDNSNLIYEHEKSELDIAKNIGCRIRTYSELMTAVANQTVDRYTSLCLRNGPQTADYNEFLMNFCGVCLFYKDCELHIPNKNCRMMLAKEELNNGKEK